MKAIAIQRLSPILLLACAAAHAQTPPDAGALIQQIEREQATQLPKRVAPAPIATPPALAPSGLSVTVKTFRFAGNALLSAEQLAPAVAAYLNRPLDFNQLQAATAAVAEAYRAAGWVVRAYLPQQDIQDGIVTIQIVEAVFGKIKHEGNEPRRVSRAQIDRIFAAQQNAGEPLNNTALDRALLLADDLPGIAVAGALAAGDSDRETDLVLKTPDESLLFGDLTLDNTGNRSTGAARLAANLNVASPLGIGDLITTNYIHTQGSDYLRLLYSIPVGNDGWRIGINGSYLDYQLITSELKPLNAEGSSGSVGLDANYPIIRSRMANLLLNLAVDRKTFDNEARGTTTTRYSMDIATLGLMGNLFDSLGGGGANSASLFLSTGSRDNEFGTTDQRFSKLRYGLSRQQVITGNLSLYAALSGQEARKELDTSEKFYLGGAYGVRAYPASEAGGDSATMSNLEIRWRLPLGFSTAAFYDYGHVRNETSMSYSLKGAGLNLGWQGPLGLNLKGTWARRIGDNPNPTATGKDQDGSLDKNRFWLSASLLF